jgi:tetratricopeptide (TPR) repeat protein
VFHQYDLLHGVRVDRGSRWSWILWFKDHSSCNEANDITWTESAAINGDAVAQFIHAKRNSENVTKKEYWLEKSARNGLARASNELGALYMEGPVGITKNLTLAKQYLIESSLNNEPEAYYNLGLLGIETGNYPEAVKNFEVAATHGLSLAAYNLGVAYYMGAAVTKGTHYIDKTRSDQIKNHS